MADVKPPFPVKFFIALFHSEKSDLDSTFQILTKLWGPIDMQGEDHLFNVTDYYVQEMGEVIFRRLITFEILRDPTLLVEMKLKCNSIENELSIDGKRLVNLDAGYLDHNKVLLASAKEAGQKVYLDKGIYADLAGRYKAGKYQPFEWSFPDFRDGRYDLELLKFRTRYLQQMKSWRQENPC